MRVAMICRRATGCWPRERSAGPPGSWPLSSHARLDDRSTCGSMSAPTGNAVEHALGPGGHPVTLLPVTGSRNEHARELLSAIWPSLPARSVSAGFYHRYYRAGGRAAASRAARTSSICILSAARPAASTRAGGTARLVLHLHHPHPIGLEPEAAAQHSTRWMPWRHARIMSPTITAQFPAHAAKVVTIGNGVDPGHLWRSGLPRPPAPTGLLYVGRLSPEKGVHVLAKAFNAVIAQRPEPPWIWSGDLATCRPRSCGSSVRPLAPPTWLGCTAATRLPRLLAK